MEPAVYFFIVLGLFGLNRMQEDNTKVFDGNRRQLKRGPFGSDPKYIAELESYIACVYDHYQWMIIHIGLFSIGVALCYVKLVHPSEPVSIFAVMFVGLWVTMRSASRFQRDHVRYADELSGKVPYEYPLHSLLLADECPETNS